MVNAQETGTGKTEKPENETPLSPDTEDIMDEMERDEEEERDSSVSQPQPESEAEETDKPKKN